MLNTGYTDFVYNGASNEKGESVGGSTSHKNGLNLDLRYLRTDKTGDNVHLNSNSETGNPCGWKGLDVTRQNKFHEELKRFGWGTRIAWKYWDATSSPNTGATWNTWYTQWKIDNPTKTDDASKPILKNITHLANHYHHAHVQSYSPTLEDITETP